jgi:hypothetical protein
MRMPELAAGRPGEPHRFASGRQFHLSRTGAGIYQGPVSYRFPALALALVAPLFALLVGSSPAYGWGGKVKLVRKYRPGQKMVYQTTIQTHASIQSDPPGLKAFLPPVPTDLKTRQQNTVTIKEVKPNGTAVIQNRFDQFEFQSNLLEVLPEKLRESAKETQEDFSQKVAGQVLTARYDSGGRLIDFEGADELVAQVEAPLREPLRQILRVFLEQMGGQALYPGHPVKRGEEWKKSLDSPPTDDYPYAIKGENTLHYAGKTKYQGVKAALVDFNFTDVMLPEVERLRRAGPLAQLNASGLDLDLHIEGQGKGRVVLALDDGRVLQNHATIHETLKARLKSSRGLPVSITRPVQLQIDSHTELAVEGAGK